MSSDNETFNIPGNQQGGKPKPGTSAEELG